MISLLTAFLAVSVCVSLWWHTVESDYNRTPISVSSAANSAETAANTDTLSQSSNPAGRGNYRAESAADAWQVLRSAASASDAFSQLDAMARASDPSATLAIYELQKRCGAVSSEKVLAAVRRPLAPADSPAEAVRQKVIDRIVKYCNEPKLFDPDLMFAVRDALSEYAANGIDAGLVFELEHGGTNAESAAVEAVARDVAITSERPELVASALRALANPNVAEISPLWEPLREATQLRFDPARAGIVRDVVAEMMSCELGANCGAYGWYQIVFCLNLGNCAPHLPTRDFIYTEVLTSSERAVVDEILRNLRRMRTGG